MHSGPPLDQGMFQLYWNLWIKTEQPQAGKFSVKVGAGTIKRKTLSLERNSLDYDVKQHGDQSVLYSSTKV